MQQGFVIMYNRSLAREIRLVAESIRDAADSARLLSTISDIRFTSLYKVQQEAGEKSYVPLCSFEHGAMRYLLPNGEALMKSEDVA